MRGNWRGPEAHATAGLETGATCIGLYRQSQVGGDSGPFSRGLIA